jgi:hypothetical protein
MLPGCYKGEDCPLAGEWVNCCTAEAEVAKKTRKAWRLEPWFVSVSLHFLCVSAVKE